MDNQTVSIPEDIRNYLESILSDANMTTLDAASHEEMLVELYKQLDTYLTSVMVDKMSPEVFEQFMQLNKESPSMDQAQQFIKTNIPNSEQVLAQAFVTFRDMYVHNVSVASSESGSEDVQAPPPAPVQGN